MFPGAPLLKLLGKSEEFCGRRGADEGILAVQHDTQVEGERQAAVGGITTVFPAPLLSGGMGKMSAEGPFFPLRGWKPFGQNEPPHQAQKVT